MFTGCVPDCPPSIPNQVHFPTYDTTGLDKKTFTTTKGYPTISSTGEELIIFKKSEFDVMNQNSILNVLDYNTLLDSITSFNVQVKLKEHEYNKDTLNKTK